MSTPEDKFLDSFRLSSFLLLLSGCFPFSGIFRSELQFRLISFPSFYSMAFLIYIAVVFVITLQNYVAENYFQFPPFDLGVIILQFFVSIIYCEMIVITFLLRSSRIEAIFKEVDAIPRRPKKRVAELTVPLSILCLVVTLGSMGNAFTHYYYLIFYSLPKSGIVVIFVALLLRIASLIGEIIEDLEQTEGNSEHPIHSIR